MSLHQQIAENFQRWERRGRGVELYEAPVALEPPFCPFPGHRLRLGGTGGDTGEVPSLFSWLSGKIFRTLQPPKSYPSHKPDEPPPEDEEEPSPEWLDDGETRLVEIRALLPEAAAYPAEAVSGFFTTLATISRLTAFEIIATSREIFLQMVCEADDRELVSDQLTAQFPGVRLSVVASGLRQLWEDGGENDRVVLDFGLSREFMRPLDSSVRIDPFVSLTGGMASLREDEVAVYQVLFTPLWNPWADNAMAAVTKENGKPLFEDGAGLVRDASAKMARPLYGVVLRLAAKAASPQRTWEILRGMAPALGLFAREGGQALTPLHDEDSSPEYEPEEHCADLVLRRSRRCGMILNLDELTGLAHWPSPAVKTARFKRFVQGTSRRAPQFPAQDLARGAVVLGENDHEGETVKVVLPLEQRLRHIHCLGTTGMGKSTLFLSMMRQDLEQGHGFALLDPHGDLVDAVLGMVPEHRLNDVVLINPSDEERVTPFNVLTVHNDFEKALLASDLVGIFRRLSTSWGDRMTIILHNLVLAFLDHPEGGTLADMSLFLTDKAWRAAFLKGLRTPNVRFYWERIFPTAGDDRNLGPILTRLQTLLMPPVISSMVSLKGNRVNVAEIMDGGRILLARLPVGLMDGEAAGIIGSLLIGRIQQVAMSRARMKAEERRPFFCYVDECQHFVTPSVAGILSGARKYGLGLVLGHQYLEQLSKNADVAEAVMATVGTRILFKGSESDVRAVKSEFAHYKVEDFAALTKAHALARIGGSDSDFNLRVVLPPFPAAHEAEARRAAVTEASRERYTIPRREAEEEIYRGLSFGDEGQPEEPSPKAKAGKKKDSKAASPALDSPPQEENAEPARGELQTPEVPEAGTPAAEAATEPPAPSSPSTPPIQEPSADGQEKLPASEVSAPPVPSETEAEPQSPAPARSPAEEAAPSAVGLGVGGKDHRLIVSQLAELGTALGYAVKVEAQISGGRVDLVFESERRHIAFEVALGTYTAHEIGNLTKCLEAAAFHFVVSVSPSETYLKNIEKAARKTFPPEALENLRFLLPHQVAPWLGELAAADPPPSPAEPEFKMIGGRKVRVTRTEMSEEERRRFAKEQINIIASLVKRKPPE